MSAGGNAPFCLSLVLMRILQSASVTSPLLLHLFNQQNHSLPNSTAEL
jgi:hypothetical protein